MLRARQILLVPAAILCAACAPAERNEAGEIASAGQLDAFAMRVGDCYDDQVFQSEEIADVPGKPCSEPHDNEVYALFDLPGSDFPGDEQAMALADEGCLDRFEPYVGATYEESVLAITHLVPSAGSWAQLDDREVVCVAYHMELEKLTGSVRDSGM